MEPISKSVESTYGDRVQIIARDGKTVRLFTYNRNGVGQEVVLDQYTFNTLTADMVEIAKTLNGEPKPPTPKSVAPLVDPKPAAKKKAAKGK